MPSDSTCNRSSLPSRPTAMTAALRGVARVGVLAVAGAVGVGLSAGAGGAVAAAADAELEALRGRVTELERQIEALTVAAERLDRRTACMSASSSDTYFTGCNVHVRDGSGDTDGETNGLGNLIVGYDEAYVLGARRTGSHNLVVGAEHSYTSYGGMVAGFYNTVSAPYASVTGGAFNTASMNRAVVGGGERNKATALGGVVVGGTDNVAAGEHAVVAGGAGNAARGKQAAVVGGAMNSAPGAAALVAGGSGNRAEGLYASVAGGELNQALATNAVVAGGSYNRAFGRRSSVTGGVRLTASEDDASVTGASLSRRHTPDAEPGPATARRAREGWAESIRRPEQTADAGAAIHDAEVEPDWYGDNPFKLEGRDFNPRVGDPLAD